MYRYFIFIFLTIFSFSARANEGLSYKDTFLTHEDNASDKWENYIDIYEAHFSPYRGKEVDVLEVGVQNGGHLQILKKYFKHSKIYGIDIDPNVCKQALGDGITTMCFDATKSDLVNEKVQNLNFDIIIDDASHKSDDVIKSFDLLFSKVKPGGIYVVEDLHTSYWKTYGGGYKHKNSSIEYFKSIVDLINAYHVRRDDDIQNEGMDFYNKLSDSEKEIVRWVNYIVFYDSVVVIKKLETPRVAPYKRVVVGTKQPVIPTIDYAKKNNYYHTKKQN